MEKNNLFNHIISIITEDNKYLTDEKQILKTQIVSDIENMDATLINRLANDPQIKEVFFVTVGDVLVFDKQNFLFLVNSKEFLPDSYTAYSQQVGLAVDGEKLSSSSDVVLDFPYKDAVLAGGQDKDDQKREEIMYHEVIAHDEVRSLLSPKVFTNAKRYTVDGVEEGIMINDEDNLIIKGNNLIALSSLLERYEGKVKCIYIDPPFNTDNDGFRYNDKFSRSIWLTFMKNRLNVAFKLLSDDGSIFIQIDENQSHYLKVLCDQLFGEHNFMNEIVWRYRTYVGQVKDYFPKKHDLIFWYKKNNRPKFNQTYVGNYEDTPDYKRWEKFLTSDGEILYGNHPTSDSRFNAYLRKYIKQYGQPSEGDVIYKNRGYLVDDVWEDIIALDAKNKTERIEEFSGSGQKPEALLERILGSITDTGDIVLDFFMGSATTQAVAHKMGRQYIGVEQMDYIKDVSVERLNKVIEGEQGGISEDVDWKGGGSFVYCELKEDAYELIDQIEEATEETIHAVKDTIYSDERIVPYIQTEELQEANDTFNELSLEDQKQALLALVNKNKLYVPYSSLTDAFYNLSEEEIAFNRSFYEGGVHDD